MHLPFHKLEEYKDITKWKLNNKLSFSDVCMKFDQDVTADGRNAFIYKMMVNNLAVITEEVLDWCGYSGNCNNKKQQFLELISKYSHIRYVEKEHHIELNETDFVCLLIEFKDNGAAFCQLYLFFKEIWCLWLKYGMYCEAQKYKATKKLLKAANSRLNTVSQNIIGEVAKPLRENVSPNVAPSPVKPEKLRCLALIDQRPEIGREWYLVRCQYCSLDRAIQNVSSKNKNAKHVKTWYGVPHAVDVFNSVKEELRGDIGYARGNILRQKVAYKGAYLEIDDIIKAVEKVLFDKNPAEEIADTAENLVQIKKKI